MTLLRRDRAQNYFPRSLDFMDNHILLVRKNY